MTVGSFDIYTHTTQHICIFEENQHIFSCSPFQQSNSNPRATTSPSLLLITYIVYYIIEISSTYINTIFHFFLYYSYHPPIIFHPNHPHTKPHSFSLFLHIEFFFLYSHPEYKQELCERTKTC